MLIIKTIAGLSLAWNLSLWGPLQIEGNPNGNKAANSGLLRLFV